nr:peptidyl-tRNA hydrolase Pth2 [Candidatus Njordarchaeum guaymaensis]
MAVEFEFKQVIVLRTDIKMSKGKLAVQACHASVSALENARRMHPSWVRSWLNEGQKKVVAKVRNLESLERLRRQAEKDDLPNALIEDKGLTEIPPGTVTALGIGPAPEEDIDKITRDLPLL